MKQRIVCDTMIWYYLSQGKLKLPNKEKYTLVCTNLTLMELAFTPNNFRKLNEVQNAIRQILDSKAEFNLFHPFDHARKLIDKEYNPENEIITEVLLTFLGTLLTYSKDGLIDDEYKEKLSYVSSSRKDNNTEWANYLNELYQPTKELGSLLKRYHSAEFEQSAYRGWFVIQLQEFTDFAGSPDTISWELFELYENIYTIYNTRLRISKMKADGNDRNDMENMIYVQPSDLYWTLEKRWLNLMKEAKLEKYLYSELSSK